MISSETANALALAQQTYALAEAADGAILQGADGDLAGVRHILTSVRRGMPSMEPYYNDAAPDTFGQPWVLAGAADRAIRLLDDGDDAGALHTLATVRAVELVTP